MCAACIMYRLKSIMLYDVAVIVFEDYITCVLAKTHLL